MKKYALDAYATMIDQLAEFGKLSRLFKNFTFETEEANAAVTTILEKIPHTPGDVVTENEIAPSCTNLGSYDNAVYCTVCKTELSRTTQTTNKKSNAYTYKKSYNYK